MSLSRLREQRDFNIRQGAYLNDQRRAAEARCARLQQALGAFDPFVRWIEANHPKVLREMPREEFRAIALGREALAGLDTPQKCESCARLQQALVRLREMLYDATITYSSFCAKCGPMDDADPADPKFLGSPMMTETLPLREVVEKALAGPGSEQSSLTESGSAGLPDTPADSSGQWCLIHNIHQDDPSHDYDHRVCEGHHRPATSREEAALLADSPECECGRPLNGYRGPKCRACAGEWYAD
jgi:hypothetical protein